MAGERPVEIVEPGVLLDTNHLVTAFIASAVQRPQLGVLFVPQQVPIAPERQLIEEVEDAVGWKGVPGPERELRVSQPHQFAIGRSEGGVAGPSFSRLDEGEQLHRLKTPIEFALVGLEILRIPSPPTGGFAIEVDELPSIAHEVRGDAREMRLGLIDLAPLGRQLQEQAECVELRTQLVARSVALPFEPAVTGVVPFGRIPARAVSGLMTDLPFDPHRSGGETREAGHAFQPSQGMEGVGGLTAGVGIPGDGVAVHLGRQIIATVPAIVVTDLPDESLAGCVPFELVDEAQPLLSPLFQVSLVIGRLLGRGVGPVPADTETAIRGEVHRVRRHGDA